MYIPLGRTSMPPRRPVIEWAVGCTPYTSGHRPRPIYAYKGIYMHNKDIYMDSMHGIYYSLILYYKLV